MLELSVAHPVRSVMKRFLLPLICAALMAASTATVQAAPPVTATQVTASVKLWDHLPPRPGLFDRLADHLKLWDHLFLELWINYDD